MDDDKKLDFDYTFSSGTTTTYSVAEPSGGYDTPSYSISIGDMNDTGSEYTYNQPGITFGDSCIDHEVDGAMRKRLEAIENRLNILVPDPKKLEKFEALQKAYEHYKHLEKLCELEEDQDSAG